MSAPRFVTEGWLDYSTGEWKLKKGAPADIVKEYEDFIAERERLEKQGIIIDL